MKIRHLVVAGAMAVSFAALAGEMGNEKVFKSLDKNSDGKITKEEAASSEKLVKDWDKIDKDKSGNIEVAEFAALESAQAYTPMEDENEPIGAAPTQ